MLNRAADIQVPPHLLSELADYICKHQRAILDEWLKRIQLDDQIPAAETITPLELQDHIPDLLQELAELLTSAPASATHAQAEETAKVHGTCRWRQGYDLAEVLRELTQLRFVLIQHIQGFQQRESSFDDATKSKALQRLHILLDGLIANSVRQFVTEQESRLRQHVLELNQESESRLRLLRTVSHEVRNVLNAVSIAAESLPQEEDESLRNQFTMIVLRNVRHMRDLLDQLLDLSTLIAEQKALAPGRFDPCALLNDLMATYKAMAESKGLRLLATSDPTLPFVETDEIKVRQIACNLITNAIKYTEAGWVRVEARAVDEKRWLLSVEDTGVGIPSAECGKVFSEFYRAKATAHIQGAGLGLAITKRLIDLLGGTIHLVSQVGRGSKFEVTLPKVFRSGPALLAAARQ